MPERKQRVGLSELRRPLMAGAKPVVPLAAAEERLGVAAQRAVQHDSSTEVQREVQQAVQPAGSTASSLLSRVKKEPTEPCTYRLPVSLNRRLKAVARHHDFSMTAFVIEAIERHLKHFPHPPGEGTSS